jgi:hypothetical protein
MLYVNQTITRKKHDTRNLSLLKKLENYQAANIVEKQMKNNKHVVGDTPFFP